MIIICKSRTRTKLTTIRCYQNGKWWVVLLVPLVLCSHRHHHFREVIHSSEVIPSKAKQVHRSTLNWRELRNILTLVVFFLQLSIQAYLQYYNRGLFKEPFIPIPQWLLVSVSNSSFAIDVKSLSSHDER